jgi:long-chain acyl-CoA synthetase
VAARVTLCEPEELNALKQRMRAYCKEKLALYKIPVKVAITGQDQFSTRFKKVRRVQVER